MAVDSSYAWDLIEISCAGTLPVEDLRNVKHHLMKHVHKNEGTWTRLGRMDFSPMDSNSFICNGSFGKIFKVKHLRTGKSYAMKKSAKEGTNAEYAFREMEIHTKLNPKYVVSGAYAFQDTLYLYIALELMHCDLHDFLKMDIPSPQKENMCWYFLGRLAEAISYLHSCNIVHGDLKPENIMVGYDSQLKLNDFGNARGCKPGKSVKFSGGTRVYYAPENYGSHLVAPRISFKSEWFTFGAICFEFINQWHQRLVSSRMDVLLAEKFVKNQSQIRERTQILMPDERIFVERFLRHNENNREKFSLVFVPANRRESVELNHGQFHDTYSGFITSVLKQNRIECSSHVRADLHNNADMNTRLSFAGYYFPQEKFGNLVLNQIKKENESLREQLSKISTLQTIESKAPCTEDNVVHLKSICAKHLKQVENVTKQAPKKAFNQPKKSFICGTCSSSFSTKGDFNKHCKSIHSTNVICCTYPNCNLEFKRPDTLNDHINSMHTKIKRFKCSFPSCEADFVNRSGRRYHMMKAHK